MITKEAYWGKVYHQSVEDLSKDELYRAFFLDIVPMLETKKAFKPLFGNLDGSISRGMSNNTSDVDIHVFGETDHIDIALELSYGEASLKTRKVTFDIALHACNVTLDSLGDYNARDKKYPTVFYREKEEKKAYSPQHIHWNIRFRPDGEIFELMQFLIADTIFLRKSEEDKIGLQKLYKQYRVIDMMDLQFVRAYGNYNNLMKDGQEEVLVRKYLYTLYEIFFCNWLLEKRSRPPLDFKELLKGQSLDDQLVENIMFVFYLNQCAIEHKSKQKCPKQPIINSYISETLSILVNEIAKYNPLTPYSEIIENSEKSKRQKIYFF